MASLNINNIRNWDYSTFTKWLQSVSPDSDENNIVEFKVQIHNKGKECRKDFSGFANAEGGYIIFGIQNITKGIVGIEFDIDFETRIQNHLNTSCIDPEVQWETIKKLQIPKQNPPKYIYVVKIDKTFPFWRRPHISDGVIYIRKHGITEPIKNLSELRRNYFQTNEFFPEDVKYLDSLIKELSDSEYEIDSIDYATLRLWIGIKQYLSDEIYSGISDKKRALCDELRILYRKISDYIEAIKRQKSKTVMITGVSMVSGSDPDLQKLIEDTNNNLVEFKTKFERYLSL